MTVQQLPANGIMLFDELNQITLLIKHATSPASKINFLDTIRELYGFKGVFRPDLQELVTKIQASKLMGSPFPDFPAHHHREIPQEEYIKAIDYWEQKFTEFLDKSCSSHFRLC